MINVVRGLFKVRVRIDVASNNFNILLEWKATEKFITNIFPIDDHFPTCSWTEEIHSNVPFSTIHSPLVSFEPRHSSLVAVQFSSIISM